MAEIQDITQISVNGTVYSAGGGNDSPFTLTEKNGAQMSACTSTGQYAVAEGGGTKAFGNYSHAEGSGTTASGYHSHAEGGGTTASNYFSHAEGAVTKANGQASHAEGQGTTANGWFSHAESSGTTANGNHSHAEGYGTTAGGVYSHAEGFRTSATTDSEHASGQFNVSLSGSSTWGDSGNTLFTVGNGDSSANTHNALQIMQDGTIYIADTSGKGQYYQKPMLILQEIIKGLEETNNVLQQEISTLKEKVATLEANEVTKSEVEKGFNNVITVVDNNKLRIRNNALEDESTD